MLPGPEWYARALMEGTRSWLAVVMATVVAVSSWSGAVWCVAADHAGLEPAGEACCTGTEAPAPGDTGWRGGEDGCGPCLDVAVASSSSVPPLGPALTPTTAAPERHVATSGGGAASTSLPGRPGRLLDGTLLRL